MPETEYEIVHFRPEHESQVLELLGALWKYDDDARAKLFRWKYLENPSADESLGIVALHDGRVVGFRGYFVNRFVLDGYHDKVGILHPVDTCVDPIHRRAGLSVAMGTLAMQYDTSKYRLFMNMTCSEQSLPGYLKMGFQPLAKKVYLVQHGLNPMRWLRARRPHIHRPLAESQITFGRTGNLLVTDAPLPAGMASVIESEPHAGRVLRLHQDESFFGWRYRNPVHKYVFYFLLDGDALRGYVALNVSANNLVGEILDYGAREENALREILNYLSLSRHFSALSVLNYGVDVRLKRVLTDLGFATVHPLKRLLGRASPEARALPLLIRPITRSFTANDFVIEGVDSRKINNWRLKPVCSDAV